MEYEAARRGNSSHLSSFLTALRLAVLSFLVTHPVYAQSACSATDSDSTVIPWQAGDLTTFRYQKPLLAHRDEWRASSIAQDLIDLNLVSLPEVHAVSGSDAKRFPLRELLGWINFRASWKLPVIESRCGWTYLGYDPVSLKASKNFEVKVYPIYRQGSNWKKKYELNTVMPKIILPRVSKRISRIITHHPARSADESGEDKNFWRTIQTGNQPLLMTEGLKKGLSLLSAGYAAVNVPGACQGAMRISVDAQGKPSAHLVDELLPFLQKRREITIVFDTDQETWLLNLVRSSTWVLVGLLRERGHTINVIVLPEDTKGVDDYLLKYGKQRFDQLYKVRKSPEEFERLLPTPLVLEEVIKTEGCVTPCEGICGFPN